METVSLNLLHQEIQSRMQLGMGYNWFDYFGCGEYYARWENYSLQEALYPNLENTSAWSALAEGMDALKLGWIRFGLPPNPHVDAEGKPRLDTVHIQRLKWICAWAQERGKKVLLDFFTTPEFYEHALPSGIKTPHHWLINMAPEDNRRYAREFVVPLLKTLVQDYDLQAIRYFNPVNEPMEYGVFQTPGDNPPAIIAYVGLYREIREALDEVGISRERLGLVGMDTIEPLQQLLNMHAHKVDIDPYIEAYSVHHYNLRLDHFPPKVTPDNTPDYFDSGIAGVIEREDGEVLRYCQQLGKPLWALEMGSFYNGKFATPEGVSRFETVLTVAEAIIRAANMGISTFCIWSLLNTDQVDGHWSVLRIDGNSWQGAGCAFDLYQMLGSHLRPEATIVPFRPEPEARPRHLYGSWANGPGKEETLILVHDDQTQSRRVALEVPKSLRGRQGFWQQRTEDSTGIQISSLTFPEQGALMLDLPPFSVHFLGLAEA